jgi:DNA repair protein RecO (recombination protein O)
LVFFYRPNRDLHSLNSFDISEAFFELREDLTKIAYGSYLAELVDRMAPENQPDVQIFELLYLTLLAMKGIKEPVLLSRAFEIRLLSLSGFEPQLESCIKCAEAIIDIGSIRVGFSYKLGGTICHKCIHKDLEAVIISRGTLELMKSLKKLPLDLVLRLRATEQIKKELNLSLSHFTTYHIGQRLKSVKFIETLETLETLETHTDTDSGSKGSKIFET